MAADTRARFDRRTLIVNAFIGGLIGGVFGFAIQNWLPWLIAGVLFGVSIVLISEPVFRRFKRLKRCRLLITVFVEALLIVYVGLPLYGGYVYNHPVRYPVMITPSDIGFAYETVHMTTKDGITLVGWYIPSRNGAAIIAVHGFNGNRTHTIYHAQALAEHGYGVLMFDMRAHGESGGDRFGNAWNGDLDVLAAVGYLQRRSDVTPDRIGAIGLSAGAEAIIYGAARTDQIRALIADGAGATRHEDLVDPYIPEVQDWWFMSPANWLLDRTTELFCGCAANTPLSEAVKRITPRPILFIAAGQAPYERSLAQRYATNIGSSASVWTIADAYHCGGMLAHHDEYAQRMIDFFDMNLSGR